MVQVMDSLRYGGKVEDFTEEEYAPLAKRHRSTTAPLIQQQQQGMSSHGFPVSPSQYNPLDEPSPLGLSLRKSPSLLNLIQTRLSKGSDASSLLSCGESDNSVSKKEAKGNASSSAADKLKASNFPALFLKIGNWEYTSKYEGDLVAKCYFAKHKLVWEVLEGGLKSKIEIQWSDIMSLKADLPDDGPGSLTIVLARQPIFFRETNPQPRKHTLWQATTDFTDGQASKNKKHYIQCPLGVLNKHYEKLIQCDVRLSILSRQSEITMDSPYFESQASVFEDPEETKGDGGSQVQGDANGSPSGFEDEASAAATQLSSFSVGQNAVAAKHLSIEAPSPSSVMDTHAIEGIRMLDNHDFERQKRCEGLEVPGLHHSMSMSDLVKHLGNHISEQMTSGSFPSDKISECQEMFDNVTQVLLSDTHSAAGLDEKSLMKKVNSLCCLLQEPAVPSSSRLDGGNRHESTEKGKGVTFNLTNDYIPERETNIMKAPEGYFHDDQSFNQTSGLPRRDSLADLLFNLPRIASLPKFLSGITENNEYQSM